MEKDENVSPEVKVETVTTEAALNEIKKLKESTVSKEEYQKMVDENKSLLDKIVNGGNLEEKKIAEPIDVDELRRDLFTNPNLNNLEYCSKALQLRNYILETSGEDIFVPKGHGVQTSQADYDSANHFATVVQECIDYAQGDSLLFTQELQRKTNNDTLRRR